MFQKQLPDVNVYIESRLAAKEDNHLLKRTYTQDAKYMLFGRLKLVCVSIPHGGPIELFLFPASAP